MQATHWLGLVEDLEYVTEFVLSWEQVVTHPTPLGASKYGEAHCVHATLDELI